MQINLTPDLSLLAIMVIFFINYLVVSKFFLRPINEVLEAREAEVRGANEVYEASMARFNEATARMEEQLHVARREASSVRDRFRAEAATHRTAVIQKTQAEAETIVKSATATLTSHVAEARTNIVKESEGLAHLAAERILGRSV
ncbi:MAG: hypothetical protein ABIP63_03130 [Thermoanaerobaculia bacterium]